MPSYIYALILYALRPLEYLAFFTAMFGTEIGIPILLFKDFKMCKDFEMSNCT
jgi:hypothetical protein